MESSKHFDLGIQLVLIAIKWMSLGKSLFLYPRISKAMDYLPE